MPAIPTALKADYRYCRQMLPKVSRTFALVIELLSGEKYRAILLGYLLCRIADTIEDHDELPATTKQELLDEFLHALKAETPVSHIEAAFEPYQGNSPDDHLTWQTNRVLRIFSTLTPESKAAMIPPIEEMIRGMGEFQTFQHRRDTITALKDVDELERYCYYVAGTVGVMLTTLFVRYIPHIRQQSRDTMEKFSISFGVGLQLTNILKDYNTDLQRGWCYLPLSVLQKHGLTPEMVRDEPHRPEIRLVIEELRSLARHHLLNALQYTFVIPRFQREIRLFCLWPLHMANQTLSAITPSCGLFSGGTVKISRESVKHTMIRTSFDWFSNRRQLDYFNRFPHIKLI